MALVKKYCPACGNETQINDEKPFSFCLQCGEKIVLQREVNDTITEISEDEKTIIENKLQEVAFYYGTSYKKEEYKNQNEEPVYYLKAQDMLLDLSKKYPNDYRIWWELCKPIDFCNPLSGADIHNQYSINEDYFSKALDYAGLEQKRELIDLHDNYIVQKRKAWSEIQEKEAERLEKEAERKLMEQKLEQKQLKEEEAKREIDKQKGLERMRELLKSLSNGDYTMINNSHFELPSIDGNTMIGVFKAIGKCVYLNAYRIDEKKGNMIYLEQSLAIKFDVQGRGMRFDNTVVKIKGLVPPDNILMVSYMNDKILINGKELYSDSDYVKSIMSSAKKPIISLSKIFW